MNNYSTKIQQHERCISLLDFAVRAKEAIENVRHSLYVFDNTLRWDHPVKLFNTRFDLVNKLDKYRRVHGRIMMWYVDAVKASVVEYIPLDVYQDSNETAVSIAERKYSLTA